METTSSNQSAGEPDYRLPLPTPVAAKSLAVGLGGAVTPEVLQALTELEKVGGAVPPDQVAIVLDRIITELALADTVDDKAMLPPPENRGEIYDFYFAVERLPESAGKDKILRALVVALAVVMKNTAALESANSKVSPVEFGLLHHTFTVIVESLRELSTET